MKNAVRKQSKQVTNLSGFLKYILKNNKGFKGIICSWRMKSEKRFYKMYTKLEEHHGGCRSILPSKEDTIAEKLRALCFPQGFQDNQERFFWYQSNVLFNITSLKEEIPSPTKYLRYVKVESMPSDAPLPQELIELLASYGFKEEKVTESGLFPRFAKQASSEPH